MEMWQHGSHSSVRPSSVLLVPSACRQHTCNASSQVTQPSIADLQAAPLPNDLLTLRAADKPPLH
eukprot:354625-Chlamydomonas_euryale.AAC.12